MARNTEKLGKGETYMVGLGMWQKTEKPGK
jgi:hypothetical protein